MENFGWLAGDICLHIRPRWPSRRAAARQANYLSVRSKSLRNGSANMDVLDEGLLSRLAYLYGIIVRWGLVFDSRLVGKSITSNPPPFPFRLITLGKLLEARAKGRTSPPSKKLMGLPAQDAHLAERRPRKVDPHRRCLPGDLLLSTRQRIPVDAIDSEEPRWMKHADRRNLPVDKIRRRRGHRGTNKQHGRLIIEAQRVGRDTSWRSYPPGENAQASKAPIQAGGRSRGPPTSLRQ